LTLRVTVVGADLREANTGTVIGRCR